MSKNNKRKYDRYKLDRNVEYNFSYAFESPLQLSTAGRESSNKMSARTENISAEGLSFTSDAALKSGDQLTLDVFVPGDDHPVHMHGSVCWCCPQKGTDPQIFKIGVLLTDVEGKPVKETIRYDNEYHVYWSDVLESVIGKFRILQQKAQGKTIIP